MSNDDGMTATRHGRSPIGCADEEKIVLRPPLFTHADADAAYDAWGCNCGPGALAAIAGLTLDEVRPHMKGFDGKGYTNPTMMFDALRSIGVGWMKIQPVWPDYGLCRLQWEGPWTEPGVPMRVRYRYTHWVGVRNRSFDDIGIFDINCMNNGSGWCRLEDWERVIVPAITEQYKRASGKWHITHSIAVRPRSRQELSEPRGLSAAEEPCSEGVNPKSPTGEA